MIRAHTFVVVACLMGLLSSCGADTQVVGVGGSDGDFARTLGGACPESPPDSEPSFDVLSKPGVWLRIDGLPVAKNGDGGQAQLEGRPEMVGGDAEAVKAWERLQEDTLALAPSQSELTLAALDTGAEVYTKMGYEADIVTSIATVAFLEGEFAFVGPCKFEMYTALVQERFGDSAAEIARAIVGADSQETASLLEVSSATSPPLEKVSILNPETADPGVLARLELASFNIPDLPDSWVGQYAVCTRIELGWSDCVDLSSPDLAAIQVSAYVDPGRPRVEAWLVDERANLEAPISRLAEVDVPLDSLGSVDDERTAHLSLQLPSDSGVMEAEERPDAFVEGVAMRSETRES